MEVELLRHFADRGLVDPAQVRPLAAECRRRGCSPRTYLVQAGQGDEVALTEALAAFLGLPFIEMDMLEVDLSLLDRFELPQLRDKCILPVTMDPAGTWVVACGDPFDPTAKDLIRSVYGGRVEEILVPPGQIRTYLDSQMAMRSTARALDDIQKLSDALVADRGRQEGQSGGEELDNVPTVQLVDAIIKEAIPRRASDIHIEPHGAFVAVRYRIDGRLQERARFGAEAYPAIAARVKILSGINIAERRLPQDGRINMTVHGADYDFRVSTLPTVHGEKFVIRVLDKSTFSLPRAQLGFPPALDEAVSRMLSRPHGLILMSGPTGCGKSTTLYTFLRELNTPGVNIVTVEDPVEYTLPGINQVNVNPKAELTFASALRAILRQDPNIIMIGEIRDEETAGMAVRAATSGHLVLSTIHTGDAPGVLTRLVDMGISDYLVADALIGVISQRLVKRLCPACKQKGPATPAEQKLLGLPQPVHICRPQGCQFCGGTGYRGRMAVHEVMTVNDAIRTAMVSDLPADRLREVVRESGMRSMWENCRDLVLEGVTGVGELSSLSME